MKQTGIFKTAFSSLRCLYLFFLFIYTTQSFAQKDLPVPTSTIENIPAGSLIIPMDNDYQNIVPAGQGAFNLKAYGLINAFLQNGIPVKWAIHSGKERDGIDFTATGERIAPSVIPSGSLTLRGGPFIVTDTVLPCGMSAKEIIQSFGNNVAVYRLTNAADVPIRYTLTHRPKIAVFNNGGNELIHTKILDAAGISDYEVMDAADISNLKNCYTFASEPHADEDEVSLDVIENIREFVSNGGNFLAQCHAIETYENQGFFLTTKGITVVNSEVKHLYPNSDMAFAQVHKTSLENAGGSVDNFTLTQGSSWRDFVYKEVTDLSTDTVVALGAHIIGPELPGGNIFYLGGHDYSKGGKNKDAVDLSTIEKINALRMYLNVAFVPSGNSNGAWANAGDPSVSISCSEKVILGCTPTGPPGSTFLWTPSAGLSCTTCENPVAAPEVTTSYVVSVKNGCIATDTVLVTVDPKPKADFISNALCDGAKISFSDRSSNAEYWKWDFGDTASGIDNESLLQNPVHSYRASGIFKITLISGKQPNCLDTILKEITVSIFQLPAVSTPVSCFGGNDGTATVIVPQDTLVASYSWNTSPEQNTPSATGLTAGEYTINVQTANNCLYMATVSVEGPDSLTINPSLVHPTCHLPGTATVQVSGGTSPFTFLWNTSPTQQGATATHLNAGTHELTVTDKNGCQYKSKIIMHHPEIPVADFSFTTGCAGMATSDFKDQSSLLPGENPSVITSWSWDFGDLSSGKDNNSDQTHPKHKFSNAGTFLTRLIVVTDQGCSDTIVKPVEVYPIPEVILTQKSEGCVPVCVEFKEASVVSSGFIESWNWDFGNPASTENTSTSQFPVHCYNEAGLYHVTLTIQSNHGCTATKTFENVIHALPSPAVHLVPEIKVCLEDTTRPFPLLDAGPGGKYFWHETGDTTQQIVAETIGKYTVTVTNQSGCMTESSTIIKNICPPRLFVGNAFSPDKDGINDLFNVYSVHVGKFQMLIFNRWGEIIFESVDKFHFWDGIYRNEPMPIGVYEWIITYEGDCEEYLGPYKLEGSVTVVR